MKRTGRDEQQKNKQSPAFENLLVKDDLCDSLGFLMRRILRLIHILFTVCRSTYLQDKALADSNQPQIPNFWPSLQLII